MAKKLFNCISAKQFDRELLLELFVLADKIRVICKTKKGADFLGNLLSHKRATLFFEQPSTRTFLSFNNACQILGIKTSDIRNITDLSVSKGESIEDTLKTIHSYSDLLIIRHRNESIASNISDIFQNSDKPIPVINAGSGSDEHPTQALLDVYTIYRAFNGKIKGKCIALIGDLKRSRTIRSLIYTLTNFEISKYILISPDELKAPDDLIKYFNYNCITYLESNKLNDISEADIIYSTRIQDEYDVNNESKFIDYTKYYINKENINLIGKNSIILHPLPRRHELSTDIDSDPRAWYWKQEVNGLWIRTALLAYIFDVVKSISKYYKNKASKR